MRHVAALKGHTHTDWPAAALGMLSEKSKLSINIYIMTLYVDLKLNNFVCVV